MELDARRIGRLVEIAVYWIVLIPLLLFFPVLQGWDASPEPFDTARAGLFVLVLVIGLAVVSFIVREQIEKQQPDTQYSYRLGGYNADPQVSLEDLHALLSASIMEVDARIERQ